MSAPGRRAHQSGSVPRNIPVRNFQDICIAVILNVLMRAHELHKPDTAKVCVCGKEDATCFSRGTKG